MEAIKFNQTYFRNLFQNVLIPFGNVVLTNGTANFENDTLESITGNSLKVNVGSFQTTDVVFNYGTLLNTQSETDTNHFFSFGVKSSRAFTLVANIIIEGADPVEMICDVENGILGFQNFGQSFAMNRADTFTVTFKVLHNEESVVNSFNFNIDAYCLEPNVNEKNYTPKGFIRPEILNS